MLPVFTQTWIDAMAEESSWRSRTVRPLGRIMRSGGTRQKRSSSEQLVSDGCMDSEKTPQSVERPRQPGANPVHTDPTALVGGPGRCPPAGWNGLYEGVVEVEGLGKVLPAVGLGLAEDPVIDQVKDDFAKIRAPVHAPGFEHGLGKRAKLIERMGAQSFQQFAPRHMLRLLRPRRIGFLEVL